MTVIRGIGLIFLPIFVILIFAFYYFGAPVLIPLVVLGWLASKLIGK